MRQLKISTVSIEPAAEPVTIAELKEHLKVDFDSDNNLITVLNKAATRWCENYCNRSFISQTRVIKLDAFPGGDVIELTWPPLISVVITYSDSLDAPQTLDGALYRVDTAAQRIQIIDSWPTTYDKINAVTITYVAGYGTTGASVPSPILAAIKLVAGHLYEHRESVIVGTTVAEVPMAVESLLQPYVMQQYAHIEA